MKRIISLLLFIFIILLFFDNETNIKEEEQLTEETTWNEEELEEKNEHQEQEEEIVLIDGDFIQYINSESALILDSYGEPDRRDPSPYGYEWWIYESMDNQYVQFGVKDETVVTIFATGDVPISPLKIGESYERTKEIVSFEESIPLSNENGKFQFKLTENDLATVPLVKLSENVFAQLYFDTFTKELASIRLVTGDILLVTKPYGMEYFGKLPDSPSISEEAWLRIQDGREKQIYAITNVIRNQFDLEALEWEDEVSEVAFLHSEDMAINDYFSHQSLNGDGLRERLEKKNIKYLSAGENIAAMYPDAPSAVMGWLNSEGHRDALLNEQFTHIGIGVYKEHYTQNFLQKF